MRHKLKIANFTKSRAITLKNTKNIQTKYPGAQLHILINIPVKFYDSRSNTFWGTCDTSWKLQNFTKSRAITLKLLKISRRKYPGAQLHMLINIPIKFRWIPAISCRELLRKRNSDGRMDGRTDGQRQNYIPLPIPSAGDNYAKFVYTCIYKMWGIKPKEYNM
jgi:hypothetical protein